MCKKLDRVVFRLDWGPPFCAPGLRRVGSPPPVGWIGRSHALSATLPRLFIAPLSRLCRCRCCGCCALFRALFLFSFRASGRFFYVGWWDW